MARRNDCVMVSFSMSLMGLTRLKMSILIPLFLLFLTGCGRYTNPFVYTRLVMGTIVEISLWEKNPRAVEMTFNEVKRIEDKFSFFKDDSEISRINSGLEKEISPECRYLFSESAKYSDITNGAFNIRYRKDKKYDLGGIAKGYAIDRAVEILKKNGIERAMVNLGGNLYVFGYPEGKDYWIIGIKDPENPDRLKGRLKLDKESGVSTSGDYERPGHIIDPKTGLSVNKVLSVTIIAETAIYADALSTGVFILGKEKGMELIENLPGIEGVIIDKDGVHLSKGLKEKYESLY